MGLVKRCRRIDSGEIFAVKIIKSRDEEMLESIKKEFQHLKDLTHKNVVQVHELFIDTQQGEVHLVMEYFEGKELFVLLSEIGHYNGRLKRGDREAPVRAAARGDQVSPQAGRCSSGPQAEQYPPLTR